MIILIITATWIVLSVVAGTIGKDREMGFAEALIVSLFLSPITGLLMVFADKRKSDIAHEAKVVELLEQLTKQAYPCL